MLCNNGLALYLVNMIVYVKTSSPIEVTELRYKSWLTFINVWTEPLRLNLLGPGNGHVTYLGRFSEPIPKNSL